MYYRGKKNIEYIWNKTPDKLMFKVGNKKSVTKLNLLNPN